MDMRICYAALLAVLLSAGCAHTSKTSSHLGVSVGETIHAERDLVAYECKKWESTAAILFSAPKTTTCLMAAKNILPYLMVLKRFPGPNDLKIVNIKELGLVDSFEVFLYVEFAGSKERYILTDLDYPGVKRAP